jgi:deferrochelatase/peroxidase EfeB
LGDGAGAVVSANVGFLVGHHRSGCIVCLGFSVGIANPGMNQSLSDTRAIGKTKIRMEEDKGGSSWIFRLSLLS